ncbi:hypothetical protein PM082_022858 [Marasmius tenuissimus]|nr:hypothetical protein PM082_022858 [Marasmius tenuissimus]
MFGLSTIYWIFKILAFIHLISFHLVHGQPPSPTTEPISQGVLVLGSLVLINYALTDAVVFWRAWVLCNKDYRKSLYIPLFFLCCASLTITATVVIRITIQSIPHLDGSKSDPRIKSLSRAIDVCQVANLVFSLLLNISATVIVAVKSWWIKFDLSALKNRRTRGERIMALLVESGLLYSLSGITVLITTVIRLPVGTVGDIYTPVNTQIAGMYPIVVLLLVSHGQTLEKTVLPRDTTNVTHEIPAPGTRGTGPLESMRFRRATVNSGSYSRHLISGEEMGEVLRSPIDEQYSPKSSEIVGSENGLSRSKSNLKYTSKNMEPIVE